MIIQLVINQLTEQHCLVSLGMEQKALRAGIVDDPNEMSFALHCYEFHGAGVYEGCALILN